MVDIEEIINLAENFGCCPHCGNPAAHFNFCKECNKRYETEDDASWFAQYLKNKYLKEVKV